MLVLAVSIIFISGCNNLGKLKLKLHTAERINVDQYNQSLPLVVNCYQLKDSKQFGSANFHELWKQPKTILDDDLINTEELIIPPNNKLEKIINIDRKTMYIAFVGLFNTPGSNWKDILELQKGLFSKELIVDIQDNSLKIVKTGKS